MLIHSRYYIHINLWWWRYNKIYQLRLLLLISTRFGYLCKIPKTYLLFVVVTYQTSNKVFIFGRFGWRQSVPEFMYILLYLRTGGGMHWGVMCDGVFYLILSHCYWWSMISILAAWPVIEWMPYSNLRDKNLNTLHLGDSSELIVCFMYIFQSSLQGNWYYFAKAIMYIQQVVHSDHVSKFYYVCWLV